ncbi:Emopamil binding protein-domain-containing protein [Xylaria venustula]|nr:Emopamil binding protein-domain-containing protein [Xylaria venustula]
MSGQWWWLQRLLASTDDKVEDVAMPTIPPEPTHPYHPLGVDIPAYAANEAPVPVLLAALAGTLGFTVLSAALVLRKLNPRLGTSGLAVFCWFLMNTCLHCVFEGYFVLNHATLASSQSLLAQLWKEYALSDSRYLTSDFFMLSVESITVNHFLYHLSVSMRNNQHSKFFWGPLCLANAIATARNSPSRHPLRIIACVAHLYGVALYYATSQCEFYFTGRSHSRPEFVYFWVYYVGFNLPWAIVPAFLLLDSVKTVTRAMRALDKADATLSSHRIRTYGDVVGGQAELKKTK